MDWMVQWKKQLLKYANQVRQCIQRMSTTPLYTAISVVSLSSVVILSIHLLKPTKRNSIILAGLSGSGKTVLFFQLRDGDSQQRTATSISINEATFVLRTDPFWTGKKLLIHLVDVPGQSHLRPKLDKYFTQAAGLIFLVDGLRYLFDILTNATLVKRKVPVLIVCNKTDKVTANTKEFIQKLLEREIQKLRASDNANKQRMIGEPGKPFTFSQCCSKVSVGEASGLAGEISDVEQFILSNLKP